MDTLLDSYSDRKRIRLTVLRFRNTDVRKGTRHAAREHSTTISLQSGANSRNSTTISLQSGANLQNENARSPYVFNGSKNENAGSPYVFNGFQPKMTISCKSGALFEPKRGEGTRTHARDAHGVVNLCATLATEISSVSRSHTASHRTHERNETISR